MVPLGLIHVNRCPIWLIFFQGFQLCCKTVKSAELEAGWVVMDGRG
jgi:hypothetical protein